MPILKTQEEILASKINPRNNSSALGVIYYLKNRSFADYVPSSPDRVIWGYSLLVTEQERLKILLAYTIVIIKRHIHLREELQ